MIKTERLIKNFSSGLKKLSKEEAVVIGQEAVNTIS